MGRSTEDTPAVGRSDDLGDGSHSPRHPAGDHQALTLAVDIQPAGSIFRKRNRLARRRQSPQRRRPIGKYMPYVITEACKNTKDRACVDVCPVDCIYEGPDQLFIHPDECIDCGACEPECPVTAIFPEEDVPANMKEYIQINREVFKSPDPPGRPNR